MHDFMVADEKADAMFGFLWLINTERWSRFRAPDTDAADLHTNSHDVRQTKATLPSFFSTCLWIWRVPNSILQQKLSVLSARNHNYIIMFTGDVFKALLHSVIQHWWHLLHKKSSNCKRKSFSPKLRYAMYQSPTVKLGKSENLQHIFTFKYLKNRSMQNQVLTSIKQKLHELLHAQVSQFGVKEMKSFIIFLLFIVPSCQKDNWHRPKHLRALIYRDTYWKSVVFPSTTWMEITIKSFFGFLVAKWHQQWPRKTFKPERSYGLLL